MTTSISNLASLQRSEFPIARTESAGRQRAANEVEIDRDNSAGVDFADAITGAIHQAAQAEQTAVAMSSKFADGDPNVGIHEVVIASERANISLRYAVTLKNKVLEAYRDIMSTQV